MAAVESQPMKRSRGDRQNSPITRLRVAISIMIAMIGTATTPLMTALQNSALMGSIGRKFMIAPMRVATAIVP